MKSQNRFLVIITVSNLLLIWCISLLNSILSPWGFFLHMPGIFFLPHYQLLDSNRSLISLALSGFAFDHFFNHSFGFHSFSLGLIFLISRGFFHIGKQSKKEIIIFQVVTNFVISLMWVVFLEIGNFTISSWEITRFFSDILFSTIFIIPISFWYLQFCSRIVNHFEPSLRQILTVPK